MKFMKKITVVNFFVLILLSVLVMSAFAGETSGSCGSSVKWYYDAKTQTLTISGTGNMYNYDQGSNPRYFADADNTVINVVVKEGVTGIGNAAFAYKGSTIEKVTLPKSLKTIGDNAFSGTAIKTINIPSGVTNIGKNAFSKCSRLVSVAVPNSVKTLGKGAFFSCSSLSSVKIGDGVTKIDNDTFSDCLLLSEVTIGKSVSEISDEAFTNSYYIRAFQVAAGSNYFSADQYGVLYNKNKTSLINFPLGSDIRSFSVPDSVKKIADKAFFSTRNLESVKMGKNLETIGKFAFYDSQNLKSVTFNSALKTVDEQAFGSCLKLHEVLIPSGVSSIDSTAFSSVALIKVDTKNKSYSSDNYGVLFNKAKTELITYPNACKEKIYRVPGSVKTIGSNSFEYNDYLVNVEFPSGLEKIGSYAFDGCDRLQSVKIPKSVKSIGDYAFTSCPVLLSLVIEEGSTAEIGAGAFSECYELEKISISSKISKIRNQAFFCTKAYSNAMEDGIDPFYIGNVLYAYNATEETALTVKEGTLGITQIRSRGVTKIELPASLVFIEQSAFFQCEHLKSITVDDDNKYFVTDSRGVLFDKNKTRLIVYSQQTDYTSYTVPASVRDIDDFAFESGASLKNITVNSELTSWSKNIYSDTAVMNGKTGDLYINDVYLGYSFDPNQRQSNVKVIKDGTKAIGVHAISDLSFSSTRPKSVFDALYIPKSVKQICFNTLNGVDIYYQGNEAEWKAIKNSAILEDCIIHFNFNLNNHTHKYYWETVKWPTCSDKGKVLYTCPCGKKVEKEIPANGHMTDYRGIVPATKTKDGSKQKYCTGCRATYNTVTVPKLAGVKLTQTKFVYDGRPINPDVIITDVKGNTVSSSYFYLDYISDSGKIGTHSVKVNSKNGLYEISDKLSYTVLPGKTSKLTATANHSAIALKWNPVPGATGYKIYVSVQGKWKYLKTTSAAECRIDNLQAGKTYKYAVKAYTKVGDKIYDAADFAVITKSTHLTAPKITASSSTKGTAALKWTASPGATAYAVYVRENGAWKYLGKTAKTAYTVKSLQSGSVHTFAVRPMKTIANGTIKGVYGTVKVKIK